MYLSYVQNMIDARRRSFDDRPSEFRSRTSYPASAPAAAQSESILLLEETPSMASEEMRSTQEWQLASRVAASKGLSKSDLLPRFLLYVCEQHLLGRAHEITEQRIGIQIFNRPLDYNPGEDNIVRSYARMLRKRLDAYFEGEGASEPMRIVIPRGGYVPVFQGSPEAEELDSTIWPPQDSNTIVPLPSEHSSQEIQALVSADPIRAREWSLHRQSPWLFGVVGLAAGVLLAAGGWLGAHLVQERKDQKPAHAIWAQLFQPNRNTLIVPTDSGLGILENLTKHLVDVDEYASGSYLSDVQFPHDVDARNINALRRERYTSVVSLDITSALTQLPEFIANRTHVRYARSITADDLKDSNVILIGSKHTNPWVSIFERKLNFKLEYTPEVDDSFVLNEHPAGAEQKIYRNSTNNASNHTYGAIAYLPDLDGAGHVLIIQGLNMAATQAAADVLFKSGAIKPVLQQATLPNGTLRSFELLVETTSIGATAPGAQIIASRIYTQ